MGGIIGGGSGIGAILGAQAAQQATTTAVSVAEINQSTQQQAENGAIQMGLNQETFEQQVFSNIGAAAAAQQQLSAKTTQGLTKAQFSIANGWTGVLSSASGG